MEQATVEEATLTANEGWKQCEVLATRWRHIFYFDFILEKPATRPRDRCGKEQLVYPFVTGSPGSSRVSALAPYSSGDRVGSTLSTPHAGGDLGLFVGECSSPQTDAPKQRRGMSHQRPDLSSHSSWYSSCCCVQNGKDSSG